MIHILSNTSISKGNHKMKFGPSIEYNTRNTFLEKSYTKCEAEAITRPFYKKKRNLAYLYINSLKCYKVCFYCMPK